MAWMEEIRIASDGAWYFNGGKMFRMEIVSLLASHLQLKGDQYFICWRNQEVAVVVEDVPYVITGVSIDENGLKAGWQMIGSWPWKDRLSGKMKSLYQSVFRFGSGYETFPGGLLANSSLPERRGRAAVDPLPAAGEAN